MTSIHEFTMSPRNAIYFQPGARIEFWSLMELHWWWPLDWLRWLARQELPRIGRGLPLWTTARGLWEKQLGFGWKRGGTGYYTVLAVEDGSVTFVDDFIAADLPWWERVLRCL